MKALSLLSGGLDSILATKIILDQGVDVGAVYFHTPFCDCNMPGSSCKAAMKAADFLKIEFHMVELNQEFLEMVKNPKHGYGKNMNPCIDCRVLEFKMTKPLLDKLGASFIITGEVLNERPMSQRGNIMEMIDKEAGLTGFVLRPLSAKRLKETTAEKENWVDREKLLDIQGRSRKIQMELANRFGLENYPTPSGGCLLTYAGFSDKVRDLIKHNQFTMERVRLLKLGRHFRLNESVKFIVGRDESENERILEAGGDKAVFFKAKDFPGPIGALPEGAPKECFELTASILAYYINKADPKDSLRIEYWQDHSAERGCLTVKKLQKAELDSFRVTV